MLLAVLDASNAQAGSRIVDKLTEAWGLPQAQVRHANGWVGAWDAPGGLLIDQGRGWAAEGWTDLDPTEVSANSVWKAGGDFALVALREGEEILLASGRAGGYRPIFVAWPSRGRVLACTRLSVLLPLLESKPALDLDYLAASAMSRPPPPDATPYAGIKRVPIGEAWLVRPDAEPRRWSNFRPLGESELQDDDELALRLREAITDATRRSIRPAKRVGVEVSGGLDSSLLLSLLVSFDDADASSSVPEAIAYESVAPPWHDDRPHLSSLEAHLGLRILRVKPADAGHFARQPMVVDAMPAPSPTLSAASAIGRVAREQGIKILLTGIGGDDVLDGSPRLFADLARKGKIRAAFDGAVRTRGVFRHGSAGRLDRFLLRPLVASLLPRSGRLAVHRIRRRLPRWAGPILSARINPPFEASDIPATLEASPGERYSRLVGMSLFGVLPLIRLQEEVVGGYALRAPLLDDDFLRFVATVPPLSLMRGGYLRGLMREAMRGLVPEDLRLRETKGHPYWFVEQTLDEAGGLQALADLADVHMLADLRMVKPKPFREMFEGCVRRPVDADYSTLWHVLSAEAFLREYAGNAMERSA